MFKEKHQVLKDSIAYLCDEFGFEPDECTETIQNSSTEKKRPKTMPTKMTTDTDEPSTLGSNY